MDIIIKTGFEKVSDSIVFQPQTPDKGKNLAKSGHVRDVEEYRHDKVSYVIKANVVRQTSINKTPYAVKLKINAERFVYDVSCTCVYNQSEKCKHVAALIYYINNHESLSKTSFEQQWGNPTARQFAQEKYSKGADFQRMFPTKKIHVEPPPLEVSKIKRSCPMQKLLLVPVNFDKEQNERSSIKLARHQTEAVENKDKCENLFKLIFELYKGKLFYKVVIHMKKELKDFYAKSIVPSSREAIIQVCSDTLMQSNSDKWYAARRIRLSASQNVHSIKTRKTKTIDSLVQGMLYPKKVETAPMRYGKKHEKDACKQYESLYNVSVQHCGLIVCEEQPWLCASPDGVVIKDNVIVKLVEFKCPYSCAELPIVNYETKKCNVNYLIFKDDDTLDMELKRSSVYFTQCQVQMYVTGTNICDLFIYTPVKLGSCCVTVYRDEEFLMNTIRQCEKFYFEYYMPSLYNKMVVEPNKLCQPKRTFTGQNIVNII